MQELNLLILIGQSIVLPLHQLAITGHMVRLELTSIVALSIIFPIITIQALPIKLHAPYGRQDKIFTCNKSYSTTNGTILHYAMTTSSLLPSPHPRGYARYYIFTCRYNAIFLSNNRGCPLRQLT